MRVARTISDPNVTAVARRISAGNERQVGLASIPVRDMMLSAA
jgi:hypothetical protein